jgi:hypothetical protein
MLRVQPVHLQGTVQSTWEPVFAKLRPENIAVSDAQPVAVATHAVSI